MSRRQRIIGREERMVYAKALRHRRAWRDLGKLKDLLKVESRGGVTRQKYVKNCILRGEIKECLQRTVDFYIRK